MWASGAYGYLTDYLWWYLVVASLIAHTWCFFKLVGPHRLGRLRLVVGNVLVTLCLLSFAGLAAETYMRFLSVETDSYGATLTAKRWHKAYARLNSLYCRDEEWTESKPPGRYRIAFVGDSFTYGWGIKDVRDRFTDIIQHRFDQQAPGRVEVMNVAWGGWDTQSELGAIRDLLKPYDVDEIVLCYVPNDIEALLPLDGEVDPREPRKSVYLNVESSFLVNRLYYSLFSPRLPKGLSYPDWLMNGYRNPEIWAKQQQLLLDIIALCRQRNITLRVALFPLIWPTGQGYDAAALHVQLRDFFITHGVSVIDLLPTLEAGTYDRLVVNRHDPHPNELAHRLFADAIWNALDRSR